MKTVADLPSITIPRRRIRLWHFAVVVLLAAFVFGTIRALARSGPVIRPVEAIMVSTVLASGCGAAAYGMVRLSRKLTGRVASALKKWGIQRSGLVGFLAYSVAFVLEVSLYLVSIVLGPVLVVGLVWVVSSWISR